MVLTIAWLKTSHLSLLICGTFFAAIETSSIFWAEHGHEGLLVEISICGLFLRRKGLILLIVSVDIDDHPLFIRAFPLELLYSLLCIVFVHVRASRRIDRLELS